MNSERRHLSPPEKIAALKSGRTSQRWRPSPSAAVNGIPIFGLQRLHADDLSQRMPSLGSRNHGGDDGRISSYSDVSSVSL